MHAHEETQIVYGGETDLGFLRVRYTTCPLSIPGEKGKKPHTFDLCEKSTL